jgi:hypothetical protein
MHYDVRLPVRCESRAIVNLAKRSIYLGLLGLAIARLPASALLVIVHRAVLTALFATGRLVRRKRDGAHHCNQDREQDFAVIFHRVSVPRRQFPLRGSAGSGFKPRSVAGSSSAPVEQGRRDPQTAEGSRRETDVDECRSGTACPGNCHRCKK